jgi:hypothetical protein
VEDVVQGIDSTVPQQQEEEAQPEHIDIPKPFKTGHQALFVETPADWACRAVYEIKCRLCPKVIGKLEEYLTTGEEGIMMSFTKTIKDMYPDSSKKRIRGSRE